MIFTYRLYSWMENKKQENNCHVDVNSIVTIVTIVTVVTIIDVMLLCYHHDVYVSIVFLNEKQENKKIIDTWIPTWSSLLCYRIVIIMFTCRLSSWMKNKKIIATWISSRLSLLSLLLLSWMLCNYVIVTMFTYRLSSCIENKKNKKNNHHVKCKLFYFIIVIICKIKVKQTNSNWQLIIGI